MYSDFLSAFPEIFHTPFNELDMDFEYLPSQNGTIPCFYKEVTCGRPPEGNMAVITNGGNHSLYSVNSRIVYECDNFIFAYMYGDPVSICLYNGNWSSSPHCESIGGIFIGGAAGLFVCGCCQSLYIPCIRSICKHHRYRKEFRKQNKKSRMTRKFDAYVCYDFQGNNDYVTNTVLPALEENPDPPLKLCNHTRDFEPGVQIIDNIRSAIKNSKSAIIIMSQDFVDSPWCTREFEECCIENLKDPGFKLFVVLMQPRNTLTNVRQYEEHMKKFLHSDKVLNKDDPKLFEKISHYLSRYVKKPKRKNLMQLLRKKQNDPGILAVNEFSTENTTAKNLQREISSETIEIFEEEIQNKTLQNHNQLEHLENPDLPQGMAIVQVHAVDFQDDDPLLSQEQVSGRDIEWLELNESQEQGNRLQRHASLEKKQEINEVEVDDTRVPNLLEVEVRQKENDSDTSIGHKTIHNALANADDDGDDRVGSFITNDRELIELRNEKTRSRPYDAFVSFHHSGPHRDFVF